jgi:hypothetical protein
MQGLASYAGVAELVDAPDSKSGGSNIMRVQVPPPAPVFKELTIQRAAGFVIMSLEHRIAGYYALSKIATNPNSLPYRLAHRHG